MLGANDASGQYCLASDSTTDGRPFTCIDCGQAAHPVDRPGYIRFFRHNPGGGCGGEGALHKAVIALLTSNLKLCVPRHPTIQPDCDEAVVEFVVEKQDRLIAKGDARRPDLVVHGATGRFAIEVSVSNPLSEARREWFLNRGLPCLEIDVSEGHATTEIALTHFLVARSDGRVWVCKLPATVETVPLIVPITAAIRANVPLEQVKAQMPEITRQEPSSFWRSPRFSLETVPLAKLAPPLWGHRTLSPAPDPSADARPYPADWFIQDREHMRQALLRSGSSAADAEKAALDHAENMKWEWEFAYSGAQPSYAAAQAHAGRFGEAAKPYRDFRPHRGRKAYPREVARIRRAR